MMARSERATIIKQGKKEGASRKDLHQLSQVSGGTEHILPAFQQFGEEKLI